VNRDLRKLAAKEELVMKALFFEDFEVGDKTSSPEYEITNENK